MYAFKSVARTEEDRIKELELAKEGAVFLYRLACAMRSRAFKKWFMSAETIWTWATPRVFARLQRDLMFQVDQFLRDRSDDDSLNRCLLLAHGLEKLAFSIESSSGIQLRKADRRFTVPAESTFEAELVKIFPGKPLSVLLQQSDFYIRNALDSLRVYVSSRQTLVQKPGLEQFDQILKGVTEEYLLDGYPHDLLCHDADVVRSGAGISHMLMRSEYCSTCMVLQGDDIPVQEGFKVIPFKSERSNAA